VDNSVDRDSKQKDSRKQVRQIERSGGMKNGMGKQGKRQACMMVIQELQDRKK
jgi:hypothetical protein